MQKVCPNCNCSLNLKSLNSLYFGFLRTCPHCLVLLRFRHTLKFQIIFEIALMSASAIGYLVIISLKAFNLTVPCLVLILLVTEIVYIQKSKIEMITTDDIRDVSATTFIDVFKDWRFFLLRLVPVPLFIWNIIDRGSVGDIKIYIIYIVSILILSINEYYEKKAARLIRKSK